MKSGLHLIILLFYSHILTAQDQVSIPDKFTAYSVDALQEKVFLHFDRNAYLAGEICWFKVYNVDATLHQPIDLNKVAYVEIINNKNIPVLQTKVALEKGSGHGSLNLPVSMPAGYYTVRAYTNWMKNFPPEFYFEKPLLIINTLKLPETSSVMPIQKPTVRFFPEGGQLVAGIRSKIAFRMAGSDDNGIDCQGILINNYNDTVATFESRKFGIGTFQFIPVKGESYKAIVSSTDGVQTITQAIPGVQDKGFVLSLDHSTSDELIVKVHSAGMEGNVSLLVHSRLAPKIYLTNSITNGLSTFTIDPATLPDGISHFTIFHKQLPVAERLYCKKPAYRDSVRISTNKLLYGERDKVELDIATILKVKPEVTDLSVAVYKTDSIDAGVLEDFRTWLLFTSDLRGKIDSADYYFLNNGAHVEEALDNVMLTHGWTRFKWDVVLNKQPETFPYVREQSGHIINGKISDGSTGVPQGDIVMYMSVPSSNVKLNGTSSNIKGEFNFITRDLYGHNEIIVQAPSGRIMPFRIDISSPFSEAAVTRQLPSLQLSSSIETALQIASIGMQVQQSFHDKEYRKFVKPLGDTTAFYGVPDRSYLLDDYTRFTTIEEILREYVPQVNVRKSNGKFRLQMYDSENRVLNYNPLVLLDGVPIFDVDRFMTMDALKLRKLDVIANTYFLGAIRADGIVSFTSYDGDMATFGPDAGSLVIDYEGLQLHREFYSPEYSTPELMNSRIPDFRKTLYWKPDCITDQQGKAKVEFYTSDQPGTYNIIVHGITKEGKAVSGKTSLTVGSKRN